MIELLEQQKKLTSNQWKLICTANVADLLDFFDFFLIGYVTAALTKEWSLPYWQGGAILLASGLGAVPGAVVWGWLGDRIGRRTVFIWSAVTISLATGIMSPSRFRNTAICSINKRSMKTSRCGSRNARCPKAPRSSTATIPKSFARSA